MTTSKLRIDLAQGVVEAEGTESFVLAVYNDFKEHMKSAAPKISPPVPPAPGATPAPAHSPVSGATPKGKPAKATATNGGSKPKPKSRDTLTLLKDLDLSKGKNGRLKDFYAKYETKTFYERNLVFAYFLQHEAEISGITENHIFTCYRDVNAKLPGAFHQSLVDTDRRAGWIDSADVNNITVSIAGINHLEHDLAKKAAE